MISRLLRLFVLVLPAALLAAAEPTPRVFMIGDSTMADKPLDLPERGWGQALPQFFADPAMIHNHAVNGRSTKSFIDEGRWQKVLDELQPGDFVIIQFGHNDEKSEDPKRYADPATDYPENLRRFVRESRARQACPILATSVSRRKFDEAGKLVDTHGKYPDAARRVARELAVPLLDLQPATAKMIEDAGVEDSKKFFMWIEPGRFEKLPKGSQDNTHFVELGATRVAALAVEQMRAAQLPLVRWLRRADAPALIDRHALVTRHNPLITSVDPWAPLSVGNGGFAFTADVTGLQTFGDFYHKNGIPLETLARWAWHVNANPKGYKLDDTNTPFTAYGQTLGYPTKQGTPAGQWLRENPQDLPLAQLGLDFTSSRGAALAPTDLHDIRQTLDLWSGIITSTYTLDGAPVRVITACDPTTDTIAVRIESPLVAAGRLGVRLAFPRGHDLKIKNNPPLDWSQPESHTTAATTRTDRLLELTRTRDDTKYRVAVAASQPVQFTDAGPHAFRVAAAAGEVLEFTLGFNLPAAAPSPIDLRGASTAHWAAFWSQGGAVDFSGSRDPRAAELERRVVLSQYLTAIQFAGDTPPQESGLTNSTWYGKHHTEMIWWHTAHFALWGRGDFLAKNLAWYQRTLPVAREIAASRGLRGARWPKMVGPDGRESPGGNPLIIWNQPHVIHLAELLYRNEPAPATLAQYRDLVFETADCMASMLHWDEARGCYLLGPPLWIAQEIYDQATSMNPAFELSYWARALEIAQEWRERLGLPRDPEWERRRTHLAPLPQKDGRYVALESHPDTWENKESRHDHPSFLMALGMLPGDGVDPAVMRRTLDAVLSTWDWEAKIWGWDYPMIAMTAARLGAPASAVDILLKDGPNNHYMPNGHNPQRGDLPVYLPGNGALLAAVAMMAGGWDLPSPESSGAASSAPDVPAPGFPRDGSWVVRAEGLNRLP